MPLSDADPTSSALDAGRRVLRLEAQALIDLAGTLGETFVQAVDKIAELKGRLVLSGMGKSGHIARKIAATLASTGQPALFVHPGEASHGDLGMIGNDDAVLALSKTGETRELADIIAHTRRFDIPLIAITADAGSALGRAADILLVLPDAPEAVDAFNAPTTSTTLQLALGDALAVALIERRGFSAQDFRVFHPGGKLGAALRTVSELMHSGDAMPLTRLDTPMPEALLVMTEKRFGCVGVVDESGALAGVITDGDLRRHMDGLMSLKTRDVMTRSPATVSPSLLAGEALRRMSGRITVLFVVEDQRPVGVLHIHDLLRQGVA